MTRDGRSFALEQRAYPSLDDVCARVRDCGITATSWSDRLIMPVGDSLDAERLIRGIFITVALRSGQWKCMTEWDFVRMLRLFCTPSQEFDVLRTLFALRDAEQIAIEPNDPYQLLIPTPIFIGQPQAMEFCVVSPPSNAG